MNKKLEAVFQVRNNVIYSVTGNTAIKDAVDKMNVHNIGALMVVSKTNKIEGIFTERDVMKKLASTNDLVGHLPVKDIMTPKEKLVSITGDETISEIMDIMVTKKVRHLPIIDQNGILQGLVAMRDVFNILLKDARRESEDMKSYIMGNYPG
ncbi:MAG: CBS domain-containing protein [Candidatus Cloacimonetes bacterium]|nr:CBS domain-containing protein [Candidatus Cloacimonadota bacterium]